MSRSDQDDYRARDQGTLWPSLTRVVTALTIVASFALVIVMFIPKMREQQKQAARRDQLAAQIEKEQEKLNRGERELELLKTDPTYVETVARDRLGVMKEGETILRFESPTPSGKKDK